MAKAKVTAENQSAIMPMAIKAPGGVGDTVIYIRDGNGVYHPVEDYSMANLTEDEMAILMAGLEDE